MSAASRGKRLPHLRGLILDEAVSAGATSNSCTEEANVKASRPKQSIASINGVRSALRHNVRLDRINYVRIEALTGYERKLRKRATGAIEALMASISAFGIVSPILIDDQGVIIAGEGIVEAAKRCGHSEVPTIRIDHLDDTEVRFLRILP